MERKELLQHESYWITKIQLDLYAHMEQYMKENNLNKTQFAEKLGVTKGYLSQVLNGSFDHKLSKLVKLSVAAGKVPIIEFKDLEEMIHQDEQDVVTVYKEFVFNRLDLFDMNYMRNPDINHHLEMNAQHEENQPLTLNYS